ncbi:hypothetical protein Ppa06_37740 [Planomonospora parontospora subsp. parontospora]|uniref:Uncharacterized protein n=2 Tax=Planomonospora parontospora TaxID=58119 RepID=A0AA37F5X8_9ACTN|nr:hypothetical protein GCM10010126_41160 [Planomonospora parontospora]GII09976.1 hypothetical protein Ppa06_37740 [Planomonospora parontospora subsp. parontospora]
MVACWVSVGPEQGIGPLAFAVVVGQLRLVAECHWDRQPAEETRSGGDVDEDGTTPGMRER